MEKILTIVIPAYNSQNFLGKVLDSLLEPSVISDLDIIVVNDGSTDQTAAVCESYCEKYPESIRLITQPNKGHGGALNTGIAAAEGKYVKVIDSDDWVETENLPSFIEALRTYDCDAVLTHFNTFNIVDHTITQWRSYPKEFNRPYSLEEIVKDWGAFNQITAFHGIAYRTEFYRSTDLKLSEHVFYEDQEYCIVPFSCVKSVLPLDLVIYNYRVGDENQSMSAANLKKNISHFQTVMNFLLEQYELLPLADNEAGRDYYCMMVKSLLVSYLMTVMLSNANRKEGRRQGAEIMNSMKKRLPSVYNRARMPYQVLKAMNLFGVSKGACDRILQSDLYTKVRYKKNLTITEKKLAGSAEK